MFFGYILVLLNAVNVISAVSTCYSVNGQQYCFHTDGSVLTKDESRKFCMSRSSTLPVITDKDIDNVFQRFINDSVDVGGSDAEQLNNYVWLDAQARPVDDSVPWHWIGNDQPSALNESHFKNHLNNSWCAAMTTDGLHQLHWTEKNDYICQNHITRCDGYRRFAYRYNSTCYITHAEQVNWFTAVNRCLSKNGSLAVFDDHILINNSWYLDVKEKLGQSKRFWIGLIKSRWTWPNADRANVLYNKLSNNTESDYNCVVGTSRYWRLARCTDKYRVVCQSDKPIVDLPTSSASSPAAASKSESQFPHSGDVTSSTHSSEQATTGETTSSNSDSTLTVVVAVVVAIVVVAAIVVVILVIVFKSRRRHSKQQPNQQNGTRITLSPTSDWRSDPNHEPVYAHIEQSPEAVSGNGGLYANVQPKNDYEDTDAVVYSDLQGMDDSVPHTVAPSGDVYTQVQKY